MLSDRLRGGGGTDWWSPWHALPEPHQHPHQSFQAEIESNRDAWPGRKWSREVAGREAKVETCKSLLDPTQLHLVASIIVGLSNLYYFQT